MLSNQLYLCLFILFGVDEGKDNETLDNNKQKTLKSLKTTAF